MSPKFESYAVQLVVIASGLIVAVKSNVKTSFVNKKQIGCDSVFGVMLKNVFLNDKVHIDFKSNFVFGSSNSRQMT